MNKRRKSGHEIKIRLGTHRDCRECCAISKTKELRIASGGYLPLRYFRHFVKEKGILLIAEDGKTVVGYLMAERVTGRVMFGWVMAVKKEYRGRGIGTMMVRAMEMIARQKKAKWILFYAPVVNPRTVGFYSKLGYNKGAKVVEFEKRL